MKRGRMSEDINLAMVLVAAGRGTRLGGDIPKQFLPLGGSTVLAQALSRAFIGGHCNRLVLVCHPDDAEQAGDSIRQARIDPAGVLLTSGGASRQDSVRLGLEALAATGFPDDGIVLIHDAARPFLEEAVLLRAAFAALRHGAAIPVLPVADTLARLDTAGQLLDNPDRESLRVVQTPQAFRFGLVRQAHRRFAAEGRSDFTDDAGLVWAAGHPVASFAGSADLFKITHAADLARAERFLGAAAVEMRCGFGYDVHAFTDGDHVMLGGVRIPHSHALLGHSDADPLLHAMTDALLGTIGDGDIGQHFPPSDPRWKGAASRIFLAEAVRLVHAAGGRIVNLDGTVICEAPKVGPHRVAMQALIAEVTGLTPDRIGIKATTSERLGFTGRREGIAAMAVASVALPR